MCDAQIVALAVCVLLVTATAMTATWQLSRLQRQAHGNYHACKGKADNN